MSRDGAAAEACWEGRQAQPGKGNSGSSELMLCIWGAFSPETGREMWEVNPVGESFPSPPAGLNHLPIIASLSSVPQIPLPAVPWVLILPLKSGLSGPSLPGRLSSFSPAVVLSGSLTGPPELTSFLKTLVT